MKLRKLLSGVLAACMIATMLPTAAFADEYAYTDSAIMAQEAADPEPAWNTDVIIANLHDNDSNKYHVADNEIFTGTGNPTVTKESEKDYYTVKLPAGKVRYHKSAENSNQNAYWVGIGVPYKAGATYCAGWAEETSGAPKIPSEQSLSAQSPISVGNSQYVMFYWNVGNPDHKYGYVTIKPSQQETKVEYLVDLRGVTPAEPTSITAHFSPDAATAKNAGISDAIDNTLWVETDEQTGGTYYTLKITKESKVLNTGCSAGRYKKFAVSFDNASQTKDFPLTSGTYTLELHKLLYNEKVLSQFGTSPQTSNFDANNPLSKDKVTESTTVSAKTSITIGSYAQDKDYDGKQETQDTGEESTYYQSGTKIDVPAAPATKPSSAGSKPFLGWKDVNSGTIYKVGEQITIGGSDIFITPVYGEVTITGVTANQELTASVTTHSDKESGTIALSGSIAQPSASGTTVTLNLTYSDSSIASRTETVKLTYTNGTLDVTPSLIDCYGVKYTVDITGVKLTATGVELEKTEDIPTTSSSGITNSADKSAVEDAIKNCKADLIENKQVNDALVSIAKSVNLTTELNKLGNDKAGYTGIEVVAFLDVKATGYNKTAGKKKMVLDIKPMYKYMAVGAGKTDKEIPNSKKELNTTINTNIDMEIGLPAGFITGNKAVVLHKGHTYDGTITNNILKFKNPDGFSEFIVSDSNPAEASRMIDSKTVYYDTLQDAVDSISDNAKAAEITLLKKPASTAIVKKDVQITITPASSLTLSDNEMSALLTCDESRTKDFKRQNKQGIFVFSTIQYYKVTVAKAPTAGKGTVAATPLTKIPHGHTVTVTVTPETGFVLDELTIIAAGTSVYPTVGNKKGTYTFKMPPADTSISYSFKPAPAEEDLICKPYTDLRTSDPYHVYIHAAIQNKIMTGISDTAFGQKTTLTRAMVAQILFAKENPSKPNLPVTTKFSDVKSGDWFANAVTWAANNHIVEGYVENGVSAFKPYQSISRQELVTMMYSYAKAMPVTGSLSAYPDWNTVAPWAQAQMLWAVQNGIVTGISENNALYLKPQNVTPREQAAVIFTKYFGYIK